MKKNLTLVFLLSLLNLTIYAQISIPGTPYSLDHQLLNEDVPVVATPQIDLDVIQAEDEIFDNEPDIPYRFGIEQSVDLNLDNAGIWVDLPNGARLWRLAIYAPKALSINLIYDDFFLPAGGKLFLHNGDYSQILGAFTPRNNKTDGGFGTALVYGDITYLEYYEPAEVKGQGSMTINTVVHGYRSIFKSNNQLGNSGNCNVDTECTQGDDWRDEIKAVGKTIAGGGLCSGTLVGNTTGDLRPLFLTANHCGFSSTVVVYWLFERPSCGSGTPDDTKTTNGATLIADVDGSPGGTIRISDHLLMELSENPSDVYDVYYAGWDANGAISQAVTGIHHPAGDAKKISMENAPLTSTDYLSNTVDPNQTHWRVEDWDSGTTEGGSSGSPIFDNTTKRIIGMLSGGFAACGNNSADWYGKFSYAWLNNGTPNANRRLKDWLDPNNTGLLAIDGYGINGFELSSNPTNNTNCGANSVTYIIDVQSVGGNTDPTTLSVTGQPAGSTVNFSPNPVTPGNSSTLTVGNLNAVTTGSYTLTITGTSTSGTKNIMVGLDVADQSAANLVSPADNATGVSTTPALTWSAATGATSYDVEVATDAGFSNVVASTNITTTAWTVNPPLNTLTTYFWRVRNVRSCGNDPWSAAFSFTTNDVTVAPCLQFAGGPYTNFEPPVCYPNCQTPVTVGFEVWANEAYLLRGLTVGAEYTFEFCNGYDAADWAANITVAEWDGSNATANISTVSGCTITFTATVVDAVIIIFDTCGNPELQVDNGSPTFRCTGNGPTLPDSCPALPEGCTVSEDFTSGQPVTGWTFAVTGDAAGAAWAFDANDVGDNTPNPGAGNWATYDDDDAGNSGDNNIATAISPLVDMSNYENIELSFDYAYDQFDSETLRLFIEDGTTIYYWTGSAWSTTNTVWLSSTDQSGSFQEALPIGLDLASFNVTLQYDDQSNWAWGFGFDNFTLCGDLIEDDCPEMLAVDGDPMDSDIIDAGTYTAQNTITSTGTVEMGTTVTFEAGQSITLSPDFMAENGSTFTARIQACTPSAQEEEIIESREEMTEQPVAAKLSVYPNPFRNYTTIELVLEEEDEISVQLYDITGKQVSTIVPPSQQIAGKHQYELNVGNLGTGIYLLRVQIGSEIQTRKLSVIE